MADNPFSAPTISGYNASPPADDGSEVASNEVEWQKHLDKIGGPLKTLIETAITNVTTAFASTINTGNDQSNAMSGGLGFTPSELTIAAGVITPARSHHTVDTQSDASSDELSTMPVTGVPADALLVLRAENAGRTVVLKHNTDEGSTGNPRIFLNDDADYSLDDGDKSVTLMRRGTEWHEITRSDASSKVLQEVYAEDATYASTATAMPYDDTVPQNTEGAEAVTLEITPTNSANILVIEAGGGFDNNPDSKVILALFQDSTAAALKTASQESQSSTAMTTATLMHRMTAGTASATTFKLRFGAASGTAYRNGDSSARRFGGTTVTWIRIKELKV